MVMKANGIGLCRNAFPPSDHVLTTGLYLSAEVIIVWTSGWEANWYLMDSTFLLRSERVSWISGCKFLWPGLILKPKTSHEQCAYYSGIAVSTELIITWSSLDQMIMLIIRVFISHDAAKKQRNRTAFFVIFTFSKLFWSIMCRSRHNGLWSATFIRIAGCWL
jgi:hypothetical protein